MWNVDQVFTFDIHEFVSALPQELFVQSLAYLASHCLVTDKKKQASVRK